MTVSSRRSFSTQLSCRSLLLLRCTALSSMCCKKGSRCARFSRRPLPSSSLGADCGRCSRGPRRLAGELVVRDAVFGADWDLGLATDCLGMDLAGLPSALAEKAPGESVLCVLPSEVGITGVFAGEEVDEDVRVCPPAEAGLLGCDSAIWLCLLAALAAQVRAGAEDGRLRRCGGASGPSNLRTGDSQALGLPLASCSSSSSCIHAFQRVGSTGICW
mmetsp:Transcript_88563/g.153269  ORF Transcript_88563/g.153269 Transcript_88563/m.153269 type:complete len:217 (+) Transcript_88563:980-1630(+)